MIPRRPGAGANAIVTVPGLLIAGRGAISAEKPSPSLSGALRQNGPGKEVRSPAAIYFGPALFVLPLAFFSFFFLRCA